MWRVIFFFALAFLTLGCEPSVQPTPFVAFPTEAPTITPTPETDSGWVNLQAGLDRRTIRLISDEGALMDALYVLRVNPTYFQFDIGYSPGEPKTIRQWQAETDALIVVNGGYFTPEYWATGLTIVDGEASGLSYSYGGMVWMQGGVPSLQPLAREPYRPNQSIDDALQAFPMLVLDGEAAYQRNSVDRARRTVFGIDSNGNTLLIVTSRSFFTLSEISTFLADSDLELQLALNLDGGTSSGILLTEPLEELPAFVPLPTVLIIRPR